MDVDRGMNEDQLKDGYRMAAGGRRGSRMNHPRGDF